MTRYTCSFCTRLCAWVRLAADDASSTYSTSSLRPLTPPAAFCRPTRALQPRSELPDVDAATPVFDAMKPILIVLSVTPWSGPAVAAPLTPEHASAPMATPTATTASQRVRNEDIGTPRR